jgi:hypothetical protein
VELAFLLNTLRLLDLPPVALAVDVVGAHEACATAARAAARAAAQNV